MQQYSSPLEHGLQVITRLANPAAQTGFIYTPHVERIEQLVSIQYLIDTDVNAGNRRVFFRVSDDTTGIITFPTDITVIADTLTIQSWNINAPNTLDTNASVVDESSHFLPPNFIFPRAALLTQVITNGGAGDQISLIVVIVNSWARP